MNLPLFIAGRYLFARKSHNVINIISAISATGMAIGTAALIIILSVYNGFDDLIRKSLDGSDPDILVTPAEGKVFLPDSTFIGWILQQDGVIAADTYLQENVFVSYEGRQAVAKARGTGDPTLYFGEIPVCAVSSSLASKMDIHTQFLSKLEIYYPARDRAISIANPMSSLESFRVHPDRIFNNSSEKESSLVLVPVECMRSLLKYDKEVSAIEIWTNCSDKRTEELVREISATLGPAFKVSDRFRQNESLYKMMRYEKGAIFLILIFIIIIIAFNIFGSLSMLIIEKSEDINTFYSMGATGKMMRHTFVLEGWLISLLGLAAGLATGLLFAFIQQRFGLITIPGSYIVSAYPVIIKWSDVALTTVGVAAIGYIIALLPTSKIGKRTNNPLS